MSDHVVKKTEIPAHKQRHFTMHGTAAEWKLMSGVGALRKWSGERVRLDDKPGDENRRP